jgi:endonuclease/exonuclease/phosphatase family metal-dependent hydrolase
MRRKTPVVFLLFAFLALLSCDGRIVVLSYNVENLFDDREDGREYPEYRGQGWSRQMYQQKLAAVARAVRASSPGGPDILCLQEIESEKALRDLREGYLENMGYRYLVFVPQEGVAATVGCLSRIKVLRTRVHGAGSFRGMPLRHILEMQVEQEGSILYLFNNHWKSKIEGVEATASARRQAAEVLVRRIAEILGSEPQADLLVVGDLNENLEEYEQAAGRYRTAIVPMGEQEIPPAGHDLLFITPKPEQAGLRAGRPVLYEPWYEVVPDRRGTAAYRGRWQTPDRILLSAGLFDRSGFVYIAGSFEAVRAEFLVDPDSGFPLRWDQGAQNGGGGTSDHLPVSVSLHMAGRS